MQLVNGAQLLNITSLLLSSACLAAASSPAPVIVILLYQVCIHHYNYIN